jgi:hypothetical protein
LIEVSLLLIYTEQIIKTFFFFLKEKEYYRKNPSRKNLFIDLDALFEEKRPQYYIVPLFLLLLLLLLLGFTSFTTLNTFLTSGQFDTI